MDAAEKLSSWAVVLVIFEVFESETPEEESETPEEAWDVSFRCSKGLHWANSGRRLHGALGARSRVHQTLWGSTATVLPYLRFGMTGPGPGTVSSTGSNHLRFGMWIHREIRPTVPFSGPNNSWAVGYLGH